MSEVYDQTALKIIYENGIHDGINFAVRAFLSAFIPSVENALAMPMIDNLIRDYWLEYEGTDNV